VYNVDIVRLIPVSTPYFLGGREVKAQLARIVWLLKKRFKFSISLSQSIGDDFTKKVFSRNISRKFTMLGYENLALHEGTKTSFPQGQSVLK